MVSILVLIAIALLAGAAALIIYMETRQPAPVPAKPPVDMVSEEWVEPKLRDPKPVSGL